MSQATILLVEDNPSLRGATGLLLETHGYRVATASGVAEALRALSNPECCDLVILDLDLGSERGEDLFERRSDLHRPLPPILVVSGQPLQECARARDMIGAQGVVRKPYMPHELLSAVSGILNAA